MIWVHFTGNFHRKKKIVVKSFVNFFQLILRRNSLVNWSGTSSRKFYQRIPIILIRVHFTKNSQGKKITRKSFVKFFSIFKFESDFFPRFFNKIRKYENYEKLSILNFKCSKFQRNWRQKNSHFHFTSLHLTSLHHEDRAGRCR